MKLSRSSSLNHIFLCCLYFQPPSFDTQDYLLFAFQHKGVLSSSLVQENTIELQASQVDCLPKRPSLFRLETRKLLHLAFLHPSGSSAAVYQIRLHVTHSLQHNIIPPSSSLQYLHCNFGPLATTANFEDRQNDKMSYRIGTFMSIRNYI